MLQNQSKVHLEADFLQRRRWPFWAVLLKHYLNNFNFERYWDMSAACNQPDLKQKTKQQPLRILNSYFCKKKPTSTWMELYGRLWGWYHSWCLQFVCWNAVPTPHWLAECWKAVEEAVALKVLLSAQTVYKKWTYSWQGALKTEPLKPTGDDIVATLENLHIL